MAEAQDQPEFISPSDSESSSATNRFSGWLTDEVREEIENHFLASHPWGGTSTEAIQYVDNLPHKEVERDRPETPSRRCCDCEFFAQVGPTLICNAAEPDATPTTNPEEKHSCKHWQEVDRAARRQRNRDLQQRVTRVEDNDLATDANRYPRPARLTQVVHAIRRGDVRFPTQEEVRADLDRMGVPLITSTPNSEPNPFYVSEQQLADDRGIESVELRRARELARREEALTAEQIRLARETERRRLEVEREWYRQHEERRRIDELVNGHWDASAGEPVMRGGGRTNRYGDRIEVPRRWEEGVSVSELRSRMKDLPSPHGMRLGQQLEIFRHSIAAQNFDPRSEIPHTHIGLTLRFQLEVVDGRPCWVYQGKVIMD